jgi:magnesium chelatase accessory protein
VTAAPRWGAEGRNWPHRGNSRFVTVGRLRWHVQAFGPDDAPVLLLLHGTGAATHSWRDLAPLLATQFRVIAPDLPGHGFTLGRPTGGLAMPAMARAVGDLMGALGHQAQIVVGHSAGAAIASRMVIDGVAQPAALVGIGAALLPIPGLAGVLFPQLARMLFVNPLAPHLFAQWARIPGETARFVARGTGSTIDAQGIACYERLLATPAHCRGAITMMADWDLTALRRDLPRLTTPMLLIHGAGDTAVAPNDAREAAGLIPQGRLALLPDLGHLAHEENPQAVADMIGQFAQEVCR